MPSLSKSRPDAGETGIDRSKSDRVRLEQAFSDFVDSLSTEMPCPLVCGALASLGAWFDLPGLQVTQTQQSTGQSHTTTIAPRSMERAFAVLNEPPLAKVFEAAGAPISLGDARVVLGPSWKPPLALERIEALAFNLVSEDGIALNVLFAGRHGMTDGLARSSLALASFLASHRRALPKRSSSGPTAITGREKQVLEMVQSGLADAEVGRALGIEKRTVRFHLTNAMRRTGASTRSQLIARAVGAVDPAKRMR